MNPETTRPDDDEADDPPSIPHLFEVIQLQATRVGLTHDDVQDCAAQFVKHILQENKREIREERYLRQSARNFALNFRRAKLRLQNREKAWPETLHPNGSRVDYEFPDTGRIPEVYLMNREFRQRVAAALQKLDPELRQMIFLTFWRGRSIQQIADMMGRKPDAVKQALYRARRQLRSLLERQGMDEAAASEYLARPSIFPVAHPTKIELFRSF